MRPRLHGEISPTAEDAAAIAATRVAETAAAADDAREVLQRSRERDSAARADLLRAEELHTALSAKLNALEGLERERVGLAPAAARLLKERGMFGEGAVLGPLSDFISTDANAASLVERFLGATVNAVLVRDRSVAEAVRAWHASATPGPLLLLPVDSEFAESSRYFRRFRQVSRVSSSRPRRQRMGALAARTRDVDGERNGVRRFTRRDLAAGCRVGPGPVAAPRRDC